MKKRKKKALTIEWIDERLSALEAYVLVDIGDKLTDLIQLFKAMKKDLEDLKRRRK
jgi:hypothetical protein